MPAVPGVAQVPNYGQPAATPAMQLQGPTPAAAPAATPLTDLSGTYADVGGTIYNKHTGQAFSNPQQFFQQSGVQSFNNLKFDTAWRPNTAPAPLGPSASPVTPAAPYHPANMAAPTNTQTMASTGPTYTLGDGSTYTQNGQDVNSQIAQNAGLAQLPTADYLSLLGSQTATNNQTLQQIYNQLGIPQAQISAFALPQDSTVDVYNQAYNAAGLGDLKQQISDLNDQIEQEQQQYTDATAKTNEDPFLTEAARVGQTQNLYNDQQETMANLLNQQTNMQNLYAQGINEANNMVTRYSNDFQTNTTQNQAKLTYLLQQAEAQQTATQASKTQQMIAQYFPEYLQSSAQAKAATTPFGSAQTGYYVYNPTTKTYSQVTPPAAYTTNSVTGDVYSTVTGQTAAPTSSTSGSLVSSNPNPSAVIAGYDLTSYASGNAVGGPASQASNVQSIYNQLPSITNAASAEAAIQSTKPNSPITGQMVMDAAQQTGVDPKMIISVMQAETQLGTDGSKGSKQNNFGNVGNTDSLMASGGSVGIPTAAAGVLAVAQNLAQRKVASSTTSNPTMQAAQMLVSGQASVDQFSTRGDYQQILNDANQLSMSQTGKPFDAEASAINYENQQKAQANAVPLVQAQQVAIDHLNNLAPLIQAAGFTDNVQANNLKIASSDYIQKNPAVVAVQSEIDVVRGEIAKVLAGGNAPSDADQQEAAQILPYAVSPTTFSTIQANIQNLMQEKISEYTNSSNVPQLGQQQIAPVSTGNSGTTDISALRQQYGY